ncbi:inositol monophosphatase [Rhodobacteraceae bacterium RKSG542]|uniref:inositol monophosphatase family protein n=1 Tax=Pseudovibrio flavus TaxID=2529854 RepID=UPI0012BD2B09|nr:inositol monophosphatase family protein [Pseudovibrio flavus]MTI17629.1 inositol monophosphatase [Pseudovibrio flavus]
MSQDRYVFAIDLARRAGAYALEYFRKIETLTVESKGHQDMVSEADKDTEILVREGIALEYPDDGIVGEEYDPVEGTSGYTWIIDPIDGTANFVAGIPQWCVIIACVKDGHKEFGVIYDPCADECFAAHVGFGAVLNGKAIHASSSDSLSRGSIGLGFNARARKDGVKETVSGILDAGGVFFRNASGGLMLAYAASGRLIGYVEEHMNAWDCFAGLIIAAEAGALHDPVDWQEGIYQGAKIVVGGPNVYQEIKALTDKTYR